MNIDLKSKLINGLYLEDADILIPWLTPVNELKNFGSPQIISEGKKPSGFVYKTPYQYFMWKDRIWSGLACNIQAQLYCEPQEPKDWIKSNLFQYCYIDIKDKNFPSNVQAEYNYLVSYFTNLYGVATHAGFNKDLYRDYPYHFWEFGKIRLSVAMQERFLEFNTIMIRCVE